MGSGFVIFGLPHFLIIDSAVLITKMEYIKGAIVAIAGALIAGISMIAKSYFDARIAREKEQREYKRMNNNKRISELEGVYGEALHGLDKMIRDKGMATEGQIEKLNRLEIELGLKSNSKIHDGAANLMYEISNMAKSLPSLPEEFIPKFENDDDRKYRLEKRKKAEQKRNEEAKKYTSKLYQMYRELAIDMREHLAELKRANNN